MSAPRLTGQTSLCPACSKLFTSTHSFSQHRVGAFTHEAPHYGRACLDEAAMRAKGMAPDDRGRWRVPAPAGFAFRGAIPTDTDEG